MHCDFSFSCKAALRMGLMMAWVLLAGLGGAEGQSLPPGMVRLPGHRSPNALLQAHDLGQAPAGQPVDLALTLPLRHQAELQDLLRRLYTPGDPLHGQFLTPDEFTRRFGPTEGDYEAVAAYAEKRGLTVTGTHSNRLILNVAGPTGKVESAFGVHLRSYLDTDGRRFHAPDTDPAIPAALAGRLTGVIGLNDAAVARPHLIRKTPPLGLSPRLSLTSEGIGTDPHNGALTPKDIAAAYNIPANVVPNAANGAGQTLAVFEVDGYNTSDITAYESAFFNSLQVPLQNVLVGKATGAAGGSAAEVTLDIELMIALAPGAGKILVYEGTNNTNSLLNTYNKIATDNSAKAISTSWGIPEMYLDPATLKAENAIFQQMAAQGQSLYAASGDSGAYDDGATLSVDDPASQPYVTGVGGTALRVASPGGAYGSETTWADAADTQDSPFGSGGGGGVSQFWTIPAWQTGATPAAHGGSATMRNVPDVSLDAAPQSGYSIYFNGGWQVFGGTSCAAPLWAAFTALANQLRAANALPPLGFANPVLYAIAAGANYHADFHDIADGSVNLSYAAGTGYDNATGWGSFQGANLLTDLAVYQPGMAPSPASVGKKLDGTYDQRFIDCDNRVGPTIVGSVYNNSLVAVAGGAFGNGLSQDFVDAAGARDSILAKDGAALAFNVRGALWAKYIALGSTTGVLGFPASDQTVSAHSPLGTTGSQSVFENGAIYSGSGAVGLHAVFGLIYQKYAQAGQPWAGGTGGVLGFPTADEQAAGPSAEGTTGRVSAFEGGGIYFTSQYGAHPVYGNFYRQWAATGGVGGKYGFPKTDPYVWSGGIRQDFESGFLTIRVSPGFFDVNNDLQPDLLWQNQKTGDVMYWLMSGPTQTGSGTIASAIPTDWKIVGTPDIDGDNHADLIWQNNATGDVVYWLMNGAAQVGSGVIASAIPTDWKIVGTPDLNGDGHADLIWQNNATGDVVYWLMNGATQVGSGVIAQGIPTDWKIVGTPDLNGDGFPDLLWQNQKTGDVVYWLMSGATQVGSGSIAQGIPTAWKIVGTPDLNGDGHPDLVWQNNNTGDVVYWLMNGGTQIGSGSIVQGMSTDWKIAGVH